eukprot:INCI14319.1.p2 GENE.INCI14319.1~~INCI14319.1.p2  ORF type:complete len:456 (+),score=99.37 INCI14319.1:328-1695(+)
MKKSKSKDGKKNKSRGGGAKKLSRNFSMNSGLDHDSSTASAMAIAGAFASGEEGSPDLFVLLSIKNARNLKPMNANKQSDPYCVIRYLNVERRTRTHKNNLNPEFNQHFFFKAPTEVDVAEAEEANSAFSNPQELTIYIMDDDFGFKDNVQGYVNVEVPKVTRKFNHRDLDDIEVLPAVHHGSYKELESIKSGWMERKLKRKLAKSTHPGSLGTLSVSITVFEANLLRDALRRESNVSELVPPIESSSAEATGGGGAGRASSSIDAAGLEALNKAVETQDAVLLQAQTELQAAFLEHELPSSGIAPRQTSDASQRTFKDFLDQVLSRATVQLAAASKAEETKSALSPTAGGASRASSLARTNSRGKQLLDAQRTFFLSLKSSVTSYVDSRVSEAVAVEAKLRHAAEKKLKVAMQQLRKTAAVLKRQTKEANQGSPPMSPRTQYRDKLKQLANQSE